MVEKYKFTHDITTQINAVVGRNPDRMEYNIPDGEFLHLFYNTPLTILQKNQLINRLDNQGYRFDGQETV